MKLFAIAIACGYYLAATTTVAFVVPKSFSITSTASRNVWDSSLQPPLFHAVSTDDEVSPQSVKPSSIFSIISNQSLSSSSSSSSSSPPSSPLESLSLSLRDQYPPSSTKPYDPIHTGDPSSSSSSSSPTTPAWFESATWRSVIVVLCALWASNFAAAKLVMAEPGVDSSLYALSRFGIAAGALAPFAFKSLKRANMDGETLKQALVCGSWVACGYLGQTLGLMTTTASKSCVICSMHCVFVAAIAELWRVQKVTPTEQSLKIVSTDSSGDNVTATNQFDFMRLLPAAIAVAGVAIVELKGAGGAPTIGDALSFAQPVGFGMGYLILENLMAKKPEAAVAVSAIKLSVVALASFLMFEVTPLLHGGDWSFSVPDFSPILSSPMALGGILYTGLVTTALALWVESIAFAKVPATDASLILTTEPLFAAGIGAVALGETFGISDYVGAGLIVGACALSIFLDTTEHDSAEPRPLTDP
ncbi:EamA-like transporter family protein [Nitzschia inconspicua]|uniref:EamA-like transporter family protein n=1 Tax=Nitzschia inconspicua TaxID=303405 RepID=A0A9K3Q260_9STRA|nr:EamA-like transporter family protein [Nitzschia inconspicua]